MKKISILLLLATMIIPDISSAGSIKGKVPSGRRVLNVAGSKADTSSNTSTSFTVSAAAAKSRLYLLNGGKLEAPVVAAVKYKNSYYTLAAAKKAKVCKYSSAKLIMGLKTTSSTLDVGTIKLNSSDGVAYLAKVPAVSKLDSSSKTTISNKTKCYPEATGESLGLSATSTASLSSFTPIRLQAVSGDEDGDGLLDLVDIDEDNDGVLNSYDTDTTDSNLGGGITSARIFSNLKLSIENSLNLYTSAGGTLSDTEINNAAGQISLAMQVAGGNTNTTELDCGALNYCSSGGTGFYNGSAFPDGYDTDSDGLGTMTIGGTGDFQLLPMVTSASSINAGDTYIEVVTDSSNKETQVPALLNFVFRTTPAIKTLTMGGVTTEITYPATSGMAGSANNPITAPGGWNGQVIIVAYRPQRPGVTAIGESDYVDIGNSKITVDIPNAPCSGSGGCSGSGPGNCALSTYSTSDTNLTTSGDTLLDNRGDKSSDTASPNDALVTFTLDLDACLANHSLTLATGQKVALDLQFRSEDGDNAAQKFYIARP